MFEWDFLQSEARINAEAQRTLRKHRRKSTGLLDKGHRDPPGQAKDPSYRFGSHGPAFQGHAMHAIDCFVECYADFIRMVRFKILRPMIMAMVKTPNAMKINQNIG